MTIKPKLLSKAVKLQRMLLFNGFNGITFNDSYNLQKFGTDQYHTRLVKYAIYHYSGMMHREVTLKQVKEYLKLEGKL